MKIGWIRYDWQWDILYIFSENRGSNSVGDTVSDSVTLFHDLDDGRLTEVMIEDFAELLKQGSPELLTLPEMGFKFDFWPEVAKPEAPQDGVAPADE